MSYESIAGRRIFWKMFSNHTWRPQNVYFISIASYMRHIWSLSSSIYPIHLFIHSNVWEYESNLVFKQIFKSLFFLFTHKLKHFQILLFFFRTHFFISSLTGWMKTEERKKEIIYFSTLNVMKTAVKWHFFCSVIHFCVLFLFWEYFIVMG